MVKKIKQKARFEENAAKLREMFAKDPGLKASHAGKLLGYSSTPGWVYTLFKELRGEAPEGAARELRDLENISKNSPKNKPQYFAVSESEGRNSGSSGQIKLVIGSPADIAELLKSGV